MSTAGELHEELARITAADRSILLADRLARACTAVLPFDGAGLSVTMLPGHRLPLGASDEFAARAERLQFALGTGPCLTAQRERTAVVATTEQLQARWPVYAVELLGQTPYRSVVSLPVGGPLSGAAALSLYRRLSEPLAPAVTAAVDQAADVVGDHLAQDMATATDAGLGVPVALRTTPIDARQRIWSAVGTMASQLGQTNSAALAALRALAFTHGLDLETAADRILTGELEATT